MEDFDILEGQSLLTKRLKEFQGVIETEERPGLVFADFMPVKAVGNPDLGKFDFADLKEFGDVEAGLINKSTTVIEYADIGIMAHEGSLVRWALGATWTLFELRSNKALGIPLDIKKMENVERLANEVLQMVAFVGHPKLKKVTGLLTSPQVEMVSSGSSKSIAEMTYQEAFQFIYDIVLTNYDELYLPDTLAMSSLDIGALAGKFVHGDNGSIIMLKDVLERTIKDVLGVPSFNIKGIPARYAKHIVDDNGLGKMILYPNRDDVLYMNIAEDPHVIGTNPKGMLAVESAMTMSFGGVPFEKSDVVKYLSYKVSPDPKNKTGGSGGASGFSLPTTPGKPNATEAAIQLANERSIDLSLIEGTGADGKIGKPDVEKYLASLGA